MWRKTILVTYNNEIFIDYFVIVDNHIMIQLLQRNYSAQKKIVQD